MEENHISFLQEAIRLSQLSVDHGNEPFGALITCDGRILITAENTVSTENDFTCHAELNVVRKACKTLDSGTLAKSVLYTSTEPCAMCSTAIYWAGIRKIVFACPTEKLRDIKGSSFYLPSRELFAHGKNETQVIGPLLEGEAIKIHLDFWK